MRQMVMAEAAFVDSFGALHMNAVDLLLKFSWLFRFT